MLKEALSRMADVFLPTVLMLGQEYQQKGYVLNIRLSDGLLKARVKGRSSQLYNVHIDLKRWPEQAAHCSCQYQLNCKHAAASLFELQVKENYTIPSPSAYKSEQSLNSWLTTLREKELVQTQSNNTHEIIYLLEAQFAQYEHRLSIELAIAKRLKKGGLGKKIRFNTITASRKQYFDPLDEEIINELQAKSIKPGWFERFTIRNSDLIEKILATGRAYSASDENINLILGDQLQADLDWQFTNTGLQILTLNSADEIIVPFFLDKTWYYEAEDNCFGLLDSPYSPSQLKAILNTPAVDLTNSSTLVTQLANISPDLPRPKVFTQREVREITPRLIIRFDAVVLNSEAVNNFIFVIDIAFDYQGIVVEEKSENVTFFQIEKELLIEFHRDFSYEQLQFTELNRILKIRNANQDEMIQSEYNLAKEYILADFSTEDDLPRLYNETIPLLKSRGWLIEFIHPVYEELLDADKMEWFSALDERGTDFFSYQLGILVDGKQVSIVPLVAELISKLDKEELSSLADEMRVKLPLPDGKILTLPFKRIKPLINFLLQYGSRYLKEEQELEISRYQLILMQETEQAITAISARWQGAEHLRNQLKQLTLIKELPSISLPLGLKTVLRDYQQQGLNWLQFLRQSRFGGVLADDMGLGKTIQTLAHLLVEKEQGRLQKASLIIAPTSLVGNWFEEVKRFTPDLNVLVFHGIERHNDEFDNFDLVISTYGLIQRDKSRFIEYPFYYLILDEAQSIKNARTKTTQIIQQIQATYRLCLSGTPLENNLSELWSLFHFLMPGLLGDAKQFRQFFRTPIEKFADSEKRLMLAKRVHPFMLRRSKNQVASELPDKTEVTRTIELTGSQRDLYEAIRMSMEKKVRQAIAKQGLGKSHIVLLDALLKLRQVCCDPKLLSLPEAAMAYGNSAKLDALLELLDSLMEEGRCVLIFSQFTSMLRLIEEQLIKRDYGYLKLTGQTQNRQALVNTFQEGNTPIFLISLKAGGTGLNLTRADTVIHYDPWWNPAVEDQATDRTHRIGQKNPVFVYKLITSGTVEEAILAMQDKKRQLFEGILAENNTAFSSLTATDIEQFFMPLTENN